MYFSHVFVAHDFLRLKSGLVLEEGPRTEEEIVRAEIHEENVHLLSKLSEEDILQKKQQLEQALSKKASGYLVQTRRPTIKQNKQ